MLVYVTLLISLWTFTTFCSVPDYLLHIQFHKNDVQPFGISYLDFINPTFSQTHGWQQEIVLDLVPLFLNNNPRLCLFQLMNFSITFCNPGITVFIQSCEYNLCKIGISQNIYEKAVLPLSKLERTKLSRPHKLMLNITKKRRRSHGL